MGARRQSRAVLAGLAAAWLCGGCENLNGGTDGGPGGPPSWDLTFTPPSDPFDLSFNGPPRFPINWGPTTTQPKPPPAISGGTLAVTQDGRTAIAADPDRDVVYLVDVTTETPKLRATVSLQAGDEPGRLAEDAAGRVHIALRGGQAIATIDVAKATLIARRPVCPAPRGLVYEKATDRLHVACAGGELISLPAAGGAAVRTLHLARDLRDVVVDGTHLLVSRFRSAELLVVDAGGAVVQTLVPPVFVPSQGARAGQQFEPAVAWRTVPLPSGGAAMVHQRGLVDAVSTKPGGYGGDQDPCGGGITHATLSLLRYGKRQTPSPVIPLLVLPVDLALSPDGTKVAVVAAGNARMPKAPQAVELGLSNFEVSSQSPPDAGDPGAGCLMVDFNLGFFNTQAQPIAVAYTPSGMLLLQSREPALLLARQRTGTYAMLPLSNISRVDTGHDVFHGNAGGSLACASCHPEGGEDGRVWTFQTSGPRRTQSLRGGILGLEPFHWDGDLPDLAHLMNEVFVGRMNAMPLRSDQMQAFTQWVDSIPTLRQSPPADAAAVARGKAMFEQNGASGCVGCHSGARFSDHLTLNVGTGGNFKVPSLTGVAWRAPHLHDGCAAKLADRFSASCGGGDRHAVTSHFTTAEIADLVAYLETL